MSDDLRSEPRRRVAGAEGLYRRVVEGREKEIVAIMVIVVFTQDYMDKLKYSNKTALKMEAWFILEKATATIPGQTTGRPPISVATFGPFAIQGTSGK